MANKASLSLLFLSFLIFLCCSGFSYHDVLSTTSGTTFLERNKISKSQIQLFITDHKIWSTMFNFKSSIQKELKKEDLRIRRSLQDVNPASGTPDTPAIITVPSTNPVTVSPTNPTASTPVTVPSSTPPTPTNPANSPVPVTVPGSPPVTGSYPPPSPLGGGGGSVPGTNTQPPPSNTNAPATSGQSWCVAKTGISQTTLQTALDYACGTGTADCSQIQQGGSCYNPNSLQNHASFAFNSYYQKNPAPTSCDFGGVANVVTTNPSTGTCIFPSSSGGGGGGAGTSGSSNGTTPLGGGFGPQGSPDVDSSHSTVLRPFLGCMILVVSLVCGRLGIGSYI